MELTTGRNRKKELCQFSNIHIRIDCFFMFDHKLISFSTVICWHSFSIHIAYNYSANASFFLLMRERERELHNCLFSSSIFIVKITTNGSSFSRCCCCRNSLNGNELNTCPKHNLLLSIVSHTKHKYETWCVT